MPQSNFKHNKMSPGYFVIYGDYYSVINPITFLKEKTRTWFKSLSFLLPTANMNDWSKP